MTVKANTAESRTSQAAGAVLLWCVVAAGVVAGCLFIRPADRGKLEFVSPEGALRLLADAAIAHIYFLLPLFAWRKPQPLRASLTAAAAVVLSMAVALVILNNIVGLDGGTLAQLIGFVALTAAGAVMWAEVLREKPAVYYGVATIFGLGIPLVLFFAQELLRVEAAWLAWFSPFTAWRAVVDEGAWAPWALFGADAAIGVIWLIVVRRRARA